MYYLVYHSIKRVRHQDYVFFSVYEINIKKYLLFREKTLRKKVVFLSTENVS